MVLSAQKELYRKFEKMQSLYKNGDIKSTIESGKELLEIKAIQKRRHQNLLIQVNNLMGKAHDVSQEYHDMLKYYQQAVEVNKEKKDVFQYLASLVGIASVYINLNAFELAEKQLLEAKLLMEELAFGDKKKLITIIINANLGNLWASKGDYNQALYFFYKSLELSEESRFTNSSEYLLTLIGISNSYFCLLDDEQALSFLSKAEEFLLNVKEKGQHVNPLIIGRFLILKSILFSFLEKYEESNKLLEKLLKLGTDLKGNLILAEAYRALGNVYRLKGQFDQSITEFRKALEIYKEKLGLDHSIVPKTMFMIGNSYHRKSDFLKAIEWYDNALRLLGYPGKYKKINEGIQDITAPIILARKAELLKLWWWENIFRYSLPEKLDSANYYFEEAINCLELLEDTIDLDYKMYVNGYGFNIHNEAIKSNFLHFESFEKRDRLRQAFKNVEASRASILLETFVTAKDFAGLPTKVLERNKYFRSQIFLTSKEIEIEKSVSGDSLTDKIAQLEKKIFGLKQNQLHFYDSLKTYFPKFYKARVANLYPEIREIKREVLEEKEALVEYHISEKAIYIFFINKDTFDVIGVKKPQNFGLWVDKVTRTNLSKIDESDTNTTIKIDPFGMTNFKDAASSLYELLIQPISQFLNTDDHLIIAPSDILNYIPFEVLLTEKDNRETNWAKFPYLIRKHPISYTYSAALLNEMKNKEHTHIPQKRILGLAPFDKPGVYKSISKGSKESLPGIPYTKASLDTIFKSWGGTMHFGKEASIERFLKEAPSYQIIILPTHGDIGDLNRDLSYLALADPNQAFQYEKYFTQDLYGLELNADLVFLSACNTGIGNYKRGEGIISLARAVAYAGSKSVFTTLWNVNDKATKEVSSSFFNYLHQAGTSKAKSLQSAKLEYLEQHTNDQKAHPFYWAGLIGIGDMQSLNLKAKF